MKTVFCMDVGILGTVISVEIEDPEGLSKEESRAAFERAMEKIRNGEFSNEDDYVPGVLKPIIPEIICQARPSLQFHYGLRPEAPQLPSRCWKTTAAFREMDNAIDLCRAEYDTLRKRVEQMEDTIRHLLNSHLRKDRIMALRNISTYSPEIKTELQIVINLLERSQEGNEG